ncbi:hypothetical protein K488DRAFT_91747 [Vararia minispora EC-137]|uniref:Uncharacterized protein n=1 Tax=Vararia minispora EC-137 TaxID=1314806 RepID=A0ACB8Q578_9AGAM|nr:hypothetical protein K488DRAFT_91747 [Vararia minispora EC-137]
MDFLSAPPPLSQSLRMHDLTVDLYTAGPYPPLVLPQDSATALTAPTPATSIPSFVTRSPASVTSFPTPSHQLPSPLSSDEGEPSPKDSVPAPTVPTPVTSIYSFVAHPPASVTSFPTPSHQLPSPPSSDEGEPSPTGSAPAPTAPTPATSIPSFVIHPPASVTSFSTPSHQLPSPLSSDKGELLSPNTPEASYFSTHTLASTISPLTPPDVVSRYAVEIAGNARSTTMGSTTTDLITFLSTSTNACMDKLRFACVARAAHQYHASFEARPVPFPDPTHPIQRG